MKSRSQSNRRIPAISTFIFLLAFCLFIRPIHMQPVSASQPVSGIQILLEEGCSTVYAGEKQQLRIEAANPPSDPEVFTWCSQDPTIAEITPSGLLTPLRPGTVVITAETINDGIPAAGDLKIHILPEPRLQVSFSGELISPGTRCIMNTDDHIAVSSTWYGDYTCRYFSSDPSTAEISSDGTIRPLKPGDTRIKMIFNRSGRFVLQEQSFSFRLRVLPWLEKADDTDLVCYLNSAQIRNTADLTAHLKLHGAHAEDIRFKVKDPSLGQIENGIYTPKTDGKNIVTASLGKSSVRFTICSWRWLAHRGFSDLYPENTVDAFIGAAKAGAFAIETDLQLTADAKWVCFHDLYTACLMNTPEDDRITDHTLQELKTDPIYRIRTGNNIASYEEDLPTVASLSEYLDICSRYDICACLELKGPYPDSPEVSNALKELWDTILDHQMENRCIIFSLDAETAQAFEQANASVSLIREDYPLGSYTCCSFRGDSSMPTTLQMVSCEYDLAIGRQNLSWTDYHQITPLYHPGLF